MQSPNKETSTNGIKLTPKAKPSSPTKKDRRLTELSIKQKKRNIFKNNQVKGSPKKKRKKSPSQIPPSRQSNWSPSQPLSEVHQEHWSPRRTRDIPWVKVLRSPKPSLEELEYQPPLECNVHLLACHSVTSVQRFLIPEPDLLYEDESLPSLTKLSVGAVVPGMGRDIAADVYPTQTLMQLMDLLRVPSGRNRKRDKYYDRVAPSEQPGEEDMSSMRSSEAARKSRASQRGEETDTAPEYDLEAEILLEEIDAAVRGERAFDPDWRKGVRKDKDQYHQRWIPNTLTYQDWDGPQGICICYGSDSEPEPETDEIRQKAIQIPFVFDEIDRKIVKMRTLTKQAMTCDTHYREPDHQTRRISGGIEYKRSILIEK